MVLVHFKSKTGLSLIWPFAWSRSASRVPVHVGRRSTSWAYFILSANVVSLVLVVAYGAFYIPTLLYAAAVLQVSRVFASIGGTKILWIAPSEVTSVSRVPAIYIIDEVVSNIVPPLILASCIYLGIFGDRMSYVAWALIVFYVVFGVAVTRNYIGSLGCELSTYLSEKDRLDLK